MELDVDAGEAGLDSGCFPLGKGAEDGLPLVVVNLEKAGGRMLGDKVEGLQDSQSHLLIGQVWALVLELAECLGIGLGFRVELVMVSVFAGSVLPDAVGEDLESVDVWGVVFTLVGDTHQWCSAPSSEVVVPEMLEGRFMVDHGFVGDRCGIQT